MSDIQEEQKRLYKRAEENDIKLLKEENEYSNHCNEELRKKITNLEYKIERLEEDNKQLKDLCDKYEEEHSTKFNEWVFDKRENERLTQGVTLLTNKLIDMTKAKEDYKSRCEKAIELIKDEGLYEEDTNTFCGEIYSSLPELLNILQGVDKE